jgi:hypothetical protein
MQQLQGSGAEVSRADFSARDTRTAIKSAFWEIDAKERNWPAWCDLKSLLFTTLDLGPTNHPPEYHGCNRKRRNSQQTAQAMNWYYLNEAGEVVGPLSEETLRELHAIGRLAATTQVCREGSEDWISLAQALGTFTANPAGGGEPVVPSVARTVINTLPQSHQTPGSQLNVQHAARQVRFQGGEDSSSSHATAVQGKEVGSHTGCNWRSRCGDRGSCFRDIETRPQRRRTPITRSGGLRRSGRV